MTNREHALLLTRQCQLLRLSRSSLYYEATPASERDLILMRLIDEIHLNGSWQVKDIGHGLSVKWKDQTPSGFWQTS